MPSSETALKRLYTEEPHHSFLRPAAALIVRPAASTFLTGNHLTLFSAVCGIGAGVFTARGNPVLGGILLLAAMILDCADGQLARMKNQQSRLGRILDGLADYTTAIAVHAGMAIYLSRYIYGAWIWVLAAAVSMGLHCILFDYRKQQFLSRVIRKGGELDSPQRISNRIKQSDSTLERSFLKIYRLYLTLQSGKAKSGDENYFLEDPSKRAKFISKAGPFMRKARLLGPAGHNFLIFLSLILTPLAAEMPFFYILLIILPFNLLFLFVLVRGRFFKSW